jgi:hypothetical protein
MGDGLTLARDHLSCGPVPAPLSRTAQPTTTLGLSNTLELRPRECLSAPRNDSASRHRTRRQRGRHPLT